MMTISADSFDQVVRAFEKAPQIAEQAARLAVNEAARFGRVRASEQMRNEVNWQKGYVDQRLTVAPAKGTALSATITGRWRPTSLSRFLVRAPAKGRAMKVQVKAGGGAKELKRAFPVRLRAGSGRTDSKYNQGIAIRLPKGKQPRNTTAAIELSSTGKSTAWLLYGPSINMVFRDVRYKVDDQIAERLSSEFIRQFARLSNNG